jgi:hypothetical protein
MIDVERELREVLERRAEEAAGPAADRMPARVRSRIRRRQARTVILSGVAAALVAVGALAGARALSPPTSGELGTSPPTPPMEPDPRMTVIASGKLRGLEWTITAGQDGDVWCVDIEARTARRGEGTGSCAGNPLQDRDLVATSLFSPDFPAVVVSGFVSRKVDRVVFDFDAGGQIEGTVYPTPTEMSAPFDVFIMVVPNERPARGAVMALDADGEVLAQQGVYESDYEFFPLEDTEGNLVGSLPPGNPLWHEWIEPGTPATLENIEAIRHAATFPLRKLRPGVRPWWESRPGPKSSDQAFLDWWASYPVTD